jgi:hypothetical protein
MNRPPYAPGPYQPAGEEAERVRGYPFPDQRAPDRTAPRPTGTLEEIYARIDASTPAARLNEDLDRIEASLARLEKAVRDALEEDRR